LDTNVLISALVFGGIPRQILNQAIRGDLRLCLSEATLSELSEVLQKPKFRFPPAVVHQILAELTAIGELVRPARRIRQIGADPADDLVLECAVEARAACIVSGDAHLLALKEFESIPIVSPSRFPSLYGAAGSDPPEPTA
jgi:putative PIN family toxin of toxin-antitoxin system